MADPSAPPGSAEVGPTELREILLLAADRLRESANLLSELDRAIGDGDHGTTMARAATRIRDRLSAPGEPSAVADTLRDIGAILVNIDGGAAGPLFGSFFNGAAKALADETTIARANLAAAFDGAVQAVRSMTRAGLGDKTLLDALLPAAEEVTAAAGRGESLGAQLAAGADAAEAGARSTRELRARFGRAKHLGERVIGHEDPGARSVAVLLRAFSDGYAQLAREEDAAHA